MDGRDSRTSALKPFYRDEAFLHWVWMTSAAFALLIVLAFIGGILFPKLPASIVAQFSQIVDEAGVADEGGRYSAKAIFLHNLQAMAAAVCYGLIPALHLPAVLLGMNAILLGGVAAYYVNNGISLLLYLAGIVPHGIFELPAIILALACGLYLCSYLTGRVFRRDRTPRQPVFRRIGRVFCLVIVPLLALAAMAEAYLTPLILNALQ
jgi:stage II sporulation protein M